jgi:hypothetical protein
MHLFANINGIFIKSGEFSPQFSAVINFLKNLVSAPNLLDMII